MPPEAVPENLPSDASPQLGAYLSYALPKRPDALDIENLRNAFGTGTFFRVPAIAESPEHVAHLMESSHPGLLVFGIQSWPQLVDALAELLEFTEGAPGVMVYASKRGSPLKPGQNISLVRFNVSAPSAALAIQAVEEKHSDILPIGTVTTDMLQGDLACIELFVQAQQG